MDTRKFEYLETMRETIVHGDYEELKDYVELIRSRVKHDPDFEDIFTEVLNGKFKEVVSLIDDVIYKDMQNEMNALTDDEDEDGEEIFPDEELEKLAIKLDLDEDLEEETSFESFDEENFPDNTDEDYQ
jgi:hypothetical protein